MVGETWAGRATRWNASTGDFLGLAGLFNQPMDVHLCLEDRDAAQSGVFATETTGNLLG